MDFGYQTLENAMLGRVDKKSLEEDCNQHPNVCAICRLQFTIKVVHNISSSINVWGTNPRGMITNEKLGLKLLYY